MNSQKTQGNVPDSTENEIMDQKFIQTNRCVNLPSVSTLSFDFMSV